MTERRDRVKDEIIKSALTWGHVITISVLAIAAICNVGGLVAIFMQRELADAITRYVEAWQGFFIAGILGYDAKTTVENALKISRDVQELRRIGKAEKAAQAEESNG